MKIILYVAASLDDFIADKNGGVDWLPGPSDASDDMGHEDFIDSIQLAV